MDSCPLQMLSSEYNELQGILRKFVPASEVWAYGSRASFKARPQSDLDIVIFSGRDGWRNAQLLREAFEESSLPFSVDCWNWDDVPANFRKEIEKCKVVIQKPAGPSFAKQAIQPD